MMFFRSSQHFFYWPVCIHQRGLVPNSHLLGSGGACRPPLGSTRPGCCLGAPSALVLGTLARSVGMCGSCPCAEPRAHWLALVATLQQGMCCSITLLHIYNIFWKKNHEDLVLERPETHRNCCGLLIPSGEDKILGRLALPWGVHELFWRQERNGRRWMWCDIFSEVLSLHKTNLDGMNQTFLCLQ